MSFTSIELRPHRLGWKVFECAGVEPIFTGHNAKQSAITYAAERLRSRKGEVRILNAAGYAEQIIASQGS